MRSFQESNSCRPWQSRSAPERILVLRFHAIGDVAITLPWCAALRHRFPQASIDLLVGNDAAPLAESVDVFSSVKQLDVRGSKWIRLWRVLVLGTRYALHRYDVVVDLQRNWMSRIVRWLAAPRAWSEFDRYSPTPAGVRVEETFRRAGFTGLEAAVAPDLRKNLLERARTMLEERGWEGTERLIVVNPAGLWETRNWPLEHYLEFCRLWLKKESVRFVLLGTERISRKARSLEAALGSSVLNLAGKTTLAEAMAVLRFCSLVLSEDSGLAHMSWTSGIPTLTLLGSTPEYWARPLGPQSFCLHSGDLPCGGCMEPVCRFGDVHCLTRFSPMTVFEASQSIVNKTTEIAA